MQNNYDSYPIESTTVKRKAIQLMDSPGQLQGPYNTAVEYPRQPYMQGGGQIEPMRGAYGNMADPYGNQTRGLPLNTVNQVRQNNYGLNNNAITGVGNDLAPRAMEYIMGLNNNGYQDNNLRRDIPPPINQMGNLPVSMPMGPMGTLDSERRLVSPIDQAGFGIQNQQKYLGPEHNSCFYSCCPVQCCRCSGLSQSCGGCFSSSPSMPGGGCCGCLGLSPSAGMNMPAPGMLPPGYGVSRNIHGQGGYCASCCPCFSGGPGMGGSGSGSSCCSCFGGSKQPANMPGPMNLEGTGLGQIPARITYDNPNWIPAMGSGEGCCYCC